MSHRRPETESVMIRTVEGVGGNAPISLSLVIQLQ